MYFSKAIVVLSVALSALASPHVARGVNHRAVAHRAAMPMPDPEPTVVAPVKRSRKRSSNRCITRSSSSVAPTSSSVISSSVVSTSSSLVSSSSLFTSSSSSETPTTTTHHTTHTSSSIAVPQNVESDTPTTSEAAPTTSTTPTSTKESTTKAPTSTKHSSTAQATTSASSSSSSDDPLGILTGTHSGDGTYYATGLGACGITNTDTDYIAAVSHTLFDNYPGYNGVNPNDNPVCGKTLTASYQGKSVTVAVTDRCTGCATFDLDFSPSAFSQLAEFAVGRFELTWHWD